MLFEIRRRELFGTVRALLLAMILLIMFLLEINIEHLVADRAFLDIPPTVTIMRRHLGLRKILETIIATFQGLAIHFYRNNLKKYIGCYKYYWYYRLCLDFYV